MIVLGLILLILGWVLGIGILVTIGIIVLVLGVVFLILGQTGRAVGGRVCHMMDAGRTPVIIDGGAWNRAATQIRTAPHGDRSRSIYA